LPQYLQDIGGWTHDSVADAFSVYADTIFHYYGDKVGVDISMIE
jgi:beta-glucosidase/6-phospho-beta-glucosidase/beta-galactosidase